MVAHADKITHVVAKHRANNKPTSPCPLSPLKGGEGTQVAPAGLSLSAPPSAARRESQARGASARRLREMNEWRRGLG